MNLERTQESIRFYFSLMVAQVQAAGATRLTDVNVVSESVLLPVFREVFGYSHLRNLNTCDRQNFPGIDLADDVARIGIQVTATAGSEKVKDTLQKFVRHGLYERYDRLFIYVLTQKQRSYSGTGFPEIICGHFGFDAERDILDFRDVLRLIADFPIERARRVEKLLAENIGRSNGPALFADLSSGREALIAAAIANHSYFRVPSLGVELSIDNAWVRLRAFQTDLRAQNARSLTSEMRNYLEWHRLAEWERTPDAIDIEATAATNQLLVVIGGPGSGKSTLTRRLAWAWSCAGDVVLRVSLREVAGRLRQGETFEEALLACVRAVGPTRVDIRVFNVARRLLADGLDEADPDCSILSDHLRNWAEADPERQVVVTTRPIGYDPAWFSGWQHLELLPLGREDIQHFARVLYHSLLPGKESCASEQADRLIEALTRSHTASVAARNPQLLGVLVALHADGFDIAGNRYQLFGRAVEQLRGQHPRDRVFRCQADPAEARRTLESTGWELIQDQTLLRETLVERVGSRLAAELGVPPLAGTQKADLALVFWEERGLLERLRVAGEDVLVFVHLLFRDYAAATYLSRLSDDLLASWIKSDGRRRENRETLLLMGGTVRVQVVVNTLLQDDIPDDPISTEALLAADVLGEADQSSPEVRARVTAHLVPRLCSSVPMVAYQAGRKLLPIARVNPELIGLIARDLSTHKQPWTRENACGLAVVAGDAYVEPDALAELLPHVSNTGDRSGQSFEPSDDPHRWIWYEEPLIRELIIRGSEHLLRDQPKPEHLAAVRKKFTSGNHSRDVHEHLEQLLRRWLSPDELESSRPSWDRQDQWSTDPLHGRLEQSRAESVSLLRIIARACTKLGALGTTREADPHISTVEAVWRAIGFGKDVGGTHGSLPDPNVRTILAEVVRGVVVVAGIDPEQLRSDAEHALQEMGTEPVTITTLLSTRKTSIYQFFAGWPDSWNDEDRGYEPGLLVHWDRGRESALDAGLLLLATAVPMWSVCHTASRLMLNCIDRSFTNAALRLMAEKGNRYQLGTVGAAAAWVLGDEAATLLLDRLESHLTPECVPLVKALGRVSHNDASRQRTRRVLKILLAQPEVPLVEAAITAIEELGESEEVAPQIRAAYRWWLIEGPAGPDVSGSVPPNAAEALLRYLLDRGTLGYDEMCWAINNAVKLRRSEVQRMLLPLIASYIDEHPAAVAPAINEIERGALPADLISELSRSHPGSLSQNFGAVAQLLTAEMSGVRHAAIRALGDGWVGYPEAERLLRPLLADCDLVVRNEAAASLRRLRALRSG